MEKCGQTYTVTRTRSLKPPFKMFQLVHSLPGRHSTAAAADRVSGKALTAATVLCLPHLSLSCQALCQHVSQPYIQKQDSPQNICQHQLYFACRTCLYPPMSTLYSSINSYCTLIACLSLPLSTTAVQVAMRIHVYTSHKKQQRLLGKAL